MPYLTHALKGCGTVALALALTACGEETSGTSSAAANQSSASAGPVDLDSRSFRGDSLPQTTLVSEVSPPVAGSNDNTPVRSDLDSIDLANRDNVVANPVENTTPGQSPSVGGDPLVTLIATTDSDLNSGGTRLVWSTENVDSCTASGAWEGGIATSGELDLQHNESGDMTYSIMCNGASGTAVAMVTISVESTSLAWNAPVQNTNGTQVTDLAGYNLYYGTESGRYTQSRAVQNANQTNLELPVEPGTYYLAMTAYDLSGNESDLSNEIIRTVN